MPAPRHVFQTYIRATPEAIWQAIVDPAFTRRYFHRSAVESTFAPGAAVRYVLPDGADAVTGVIEEAEPPYRLVMTWRVLYDPAMAAEPPSRVEWILTPGADGVTRVTTVHRDLALSPRTADSVGTGWPWILDSLKSLLETGEPLAGTAPDGAPPADPAPTDDALAEWHRTQAIEANNSTWELLGRDELTADETDDLLGRAYTAAHHWRRAARSGPEHAARAAWLVSRAHVVAGHGEAALHHADRTTTIVADAGLADFDLAYAHEARARALSCLGRLDEATRELAAARNVPIADPEDRAIVEGDLDAGPWFGLPATPAAAAPAGTGA